MSQPTPRGPTPGPFPSAGASLATLQLRAALLRSAMPTERQLSRLAEAFSKGIMHEPVLHERSRVADDATLAAILGAEGPLATKFPRETFHSTVLFCEALDLYHGAIWSSRRFGFGFQFAGDGQGLVTLCRLTRGANTDFFRYTALPEPAPGDRPLIASRGGSA